MVANGPISLPLNDRANGAPPRRSPLQYRRDARAKLLRQLEIHAVVGEVDIGDATDLDVLTILEVECISARTVDLNVAEVAEGPLIQIDRVLTATADNRVVAAICFDVEGVVARTALQRRIGVGTAVEPEVVMRTSGASILEDSRPADQ